MATENHTATQVLNGVSVVFRNGGMFAEKSGNELAYYEGKLLDVKKLCAELSKLDVLGEELTADCIERGWLTGD